MPDVSLGPPPRFLADVNFNARIVAGLRRLAPACDVVRAQDIGLDTMPDPALLMVALTLDRILLTHDVNTMPAHFAAFMGRLPEGTNSPGVIALSQGLPVGVAIQALHEFWACSAHSEWLNQFTFLPL